MSTSRIGLDTEKSQQLAKQLNVLLANFQVFYMNTRGFHWNIKGTDFFELHVKFEEIYNDSQIKIDEIAERILTLNFAPLHSYEDYLTHSTIKAAINISDGKQALASVLGSYQDLLVIEREIMDLADNANDEGTNALMSDYIREQEKLVWMFSAYLG